MFMGTVNAMPSLIAKQTGLRRWGTILISPFGEKGQFKGYLTCSQNTPLAQAPATVDAI